MESEQGKHETAAQVSVAAKASVAAPRFKSQDIAEHREKAAASRAAAAAGGCPLCARVWRGSCGAARGADVITRTDVIDDDEMSCGGGHP
jgi:hypothetical protein